jgi:hypothetical protein
LVAEEIEQGFEGTEIAEDIVLEVGMLHSFGLKNKQEGERVFRQYLEKFPQQEGHTIRQIRRQLAHEYLGELPELVIDVASPTASSISNELIEIDSMNPLNPGTVIAFDVPTASGVSLVIYNTLGQSVRTLLGDKNTGVGRQEVVWNGLDDEGRSLGSGVYLIRLTVGDRIGSRKLTLIK